MGVFCSRADDSSLGTQQVLWPAAAAALRDIRRTQGRRINPSSTSQNSWVLDAIDSTSRTSILKPFYACSLDSDSASSNSSNSSSSSPLPSSPSSCDSDVVQLRSLRNLQSNGDDEGPTFSMLDQDFVVTSSVHEHLLLMIALSGNVTTRESSGDGDDIISTTRRPKVFKGTFTALSKFVAFRLGSDAKRVLYEPNAGGSSSISESLSVEYFARRFQARDIVTEMEVEYCMKNWKKVDYICTLYGERVGVSVTRAMSYPDPDQFTKDSAYRLLLKKLFGLVVARHGVKKKHNFSRCILHIWCESQNAAKLLELLYPSVTEELELIDDVIMVLTVAEGRHGRPIFYESKQSATPITDSLNS